MTGDAHSNPNSGKRVPGRRRRTSDSGRCPSPGGQQRGRRSRRTAAAPRRTTAARPVLIHQGKPFRAAAAFCQSAQAAGFTSEPCQNPLRHIKSSRSDKGAAKFTVTLVAEAAKVLTFEMAVAVAAMASVLLLDAEVNVEAACGSFQVIFRPQTSTNGCPQICKSTSGIEASDIVADTARPDTQDLPAAVC